MIRTAVALTVSVFLARCASTPAAQAPDKSVLLRADEEFARYAAAHGIAEAFAAYAAPDATILPAGADPVRGREAIRSFFTAAAGTVLTWKPYAAEIASSGDIGYTLGTYESRSKDEAGNPVTRYGKYCTIWKKQPDGSWKYVVDLGNSSPLPAGGGARGVTPRSHSAPG